MTASIINPWLFKRDRNGAIRRWALELDGATYRTLSGIVDGAIAKSGFTTCIGKNLGKKNATTPETQAEAEVAAEYDKKLERGYFADIKDVDNPVPHRPMLAKSYDDLKKPLEFPVYSQRKLDGIRCIAKKDGLWSRQGKPIPGASHIAKALEQFFVMNPDAILDGELYNHDFADDFNTLSSLIRKGVKDDDQLKAVSSLVEYHIYDIDLKIDNGAGEDQDVLFSVRSRYLKDELEEFIGNDPMFHLVETKVAGSQDDLDTLYETYLEEGYEGQMVRLNGPYENGARSWFLLKRKEFIDKEFKLLRIEEGNGNWAGAAKRVVFELEDGRECEAGLKGTRPFAMALLANKEDYIPGEVTIRFLRFTPDGMTRGGVAYAFHPGGRDD